MGRTKENFVHCPSFDSTQILPPSLSTISLVIKRPKHLTGFTREEIEEIINGLLEVLANRNPEVKPKDDFEEKHPHYRNFFVDPNPPLKVSPKTRPKLDWRKLLSTYQEKKGYPLKAVNTKDPKTKVSEGSVCRICGAPCQYLLIKLKLFLTKKNRRLSSYTFEYPY